MSKLPRILKLIEDMLDDSTPLITTKDIGLSRKKTTISIICYFSVSTQKKEKKSQMTKESVPFQDETNNSSRMLRKSINQYQISNIG